MERERERMREERNIEEAECYKYKMRKTETERERETERYLIKQIKDAILSTSYKQWSLRCSGSCSLCIITTSKPLPCCLSSSSVRGRMTRGPVYKINITCKF